MSLAGLSSLVYYLLVRPGPYPRVKYLEGALLDKAPALLTNIRLGWTGLPRTNTLAYYKNSQITDMKSFITLAPDLLQQKHTTLFLDETKCFEFTFFHF